MVRIGLQGATDAGQGGAAILASEVDQGQIVMDHRRVGTCMTRFDLKKDGWAFLRSFRPA